MVHVILTTNQMPDTLLTVFSSMESPEGVNTIFIGKFILKTEFRIPDVYEIVVTYCTDGVIEVVCTILAFDNVFYEIGIIIGVS